MPRILHLLVALFILCSLTTPLWAEAPSLATVVERLQAPFNQNEAATNIHDFSADFFQKARIASLNRTQTGRGTLTVGFAPDGNNESLTRFRWDYSVPEVQHLISDGVTLWVYLPDNHRVMVSSIADHLKQADDPLLFLRSLGHLERHFDLAWDSPMQTAAGDFLVRLTPKQPSAYIQHLTLVVPQQLLVAEQAPRFPLLGVVVATPYGTTTAIEFRDVQLNQHPASETFHFTIPQGVDIVRPTDLTGRAN
ncbi:MAG: outer membrane lipoprotein carrier protein LolA [Desulfuromonadaceae bacterium]|nr:outer membrane lipoprotein carrier protein LolA [Desulfuromonadaceae bacterium]